MPVFGGGGWPIFMLNYIFFSNVVCAYLTLLVIVWYDLGVYRYVVTLFG